VCYCLKLRRETPAGVALGVTDWKVVERWRPPSGKRTQVPGAWRGRHRRREWAYGDKRDCVYKAR
jgi:hypothetical protein